MAAGQPFDPECELAQSFPREIDLPILKRIFVAATHQERELIAISLEEPTKVEPIALCFVISNEARRGGQVEQPIVTVHRAIEFAEFGVRYVIAFGPHLPYSRHSLEQPQRAANTLAGSGREAAQHRCGVPRMGVPVRKESTIKDENPAYLGAERGFTPF